MTGIFFIAVVIAWLCAAVWLTSRATRRIERKGVRLSTGCLLFVGLMMFPIADEIIGGVQFRALCKKNTKMTVEEKKLKGMTVILREVPFPDVPSVSTVPRKKIPSVLPITESSIEWVEPSTKRVLISYKTYQVGGGWFIRLLGISEGNAPLTIEHTSCGPKEEHTIFKRLSIKDGGTFTDRGN